jgi:hypothetical protein
MDIKINQAISEADERMCDFLATCEISGDEAKIEIPKDIAVTRVVTMTRYI